MEAPGALLWFWQDMLLCYFSTLADSSATSSSTSRSQTLMPLRRRISRIFSRTSSPFAGAKSRAAEQPTMAPPRKA